MASSFASLSWSLSIAVLVSMVISLTLIPVVAAKFLAGRPMPSPGRIYRAFERIYERGLILALRVPALSLALSFVAVALGVALVVGIQRPNSPREPLVKGLETGLMPAMDEGSFISSITGLPPVPRSSRPKKMAHGKSRKILAKNPDVASFIRRTGAENGLFATQTSRGDIQVMLRPAGDDIVTLVAKPMRPPLEDLEKELKAQGKNLENPATREEVRNKYRRRPLKSVMPDEVEDQVKEQYEAEHQFQDRTHPGHGG